jgi:hypothetical protein
VPTATISRCGGGSTGGADLENTILAAGANALWKLDESSGTVAHDSSGNGFDLAAAPNPSTWGNAAGPPATTSAGFLSDFQKRFALGTYQALGTAGAPFSVFGWANYVDLDNTHTFTLINQGASAGIAFGAGWMLSINGLSLANPHKLQLDTNDGTFAGAERINSDSALAQNTWVFLAATWDGTTWRLYVDGLLQAATDSRAWSPTVGISLGSMSGTVPGTAFAMDGLMSWWGAVPGIALQSTQLLAIMASVP